MENQTAIERSDSRVSDFPADSSFRETIKDIIKLQLKSESGVFFVKSCEFLIEKLKKIIENPNSDEGRQLYYDDGAVKENILSYPSAIFLLELIGFTKIQDISPFLVYTEANNRKLKEYFLNRAIDVLKTAEIKSKVFKPNIKTPEEKQEKINKLNEDLERQLQEYRMQQQKRHNYKLKNPLKTNKITEGKKAEEKKTEKKAEEKKAEEKKTEKKTEEKKALKSQNKEPVLSQMSPDSVTYARLYKDPNLDMKDSRTLYDISEQEQKAFRLVIYIQSNEYRASRNLPLLVWNDQIWTIAAGHSKNMAQGRVEFGHDGFNDRFKSFPFKGRKKGAENVGYYFGPQEPCVACVNGWIQSPGHHKNLVGDYRYMAVACFVSDKGFYYFTQLFAQVN